MVLAPAVGVQAYEWNPAVLWTCCLALPAATALAQLLHQNPHHLTRGDDMAAGYVKDQ
jgi:hypothetical protein